MIFHKNLTYPLRQTIKEHLYSFKKYSDANVFYLNLSQIKRLPGHVTNIKFDAFIFHYAFMGSRWNGYESIEEAGEQIEDVLKNNPSAIKIIMPQDEHQGGEGMVKFINKYNIDIVFSVSPQTEWKKIYEGINFEKVKFYLVLTGYLDDKTVGKLSRLMKTTTKDIDIGYRARKIPPMLGRHGYMKAYIADIFNKECPRFELKTDISTRDKDTFYGDSWSKFLVRCKYMIGVEGGSTILDRDGSIWNNGMEYIRLNPKASFEEIESAVFPNLDGKLQLFAISPRHLECCASMTCQVLLESSYNGILKPNLHYIPIMNDFSNLDEVLLKIKNDNLREEITNRAYQDIVLSGEYSYKAAVKFVFEKIFDGMEVKEKRDFTTKYYLRINAIHEWINWRKEYFRPFREKIRITTVMGMIYFIKFLGLKDTAKRFYSFINGKKKK